jgi:hypothetical protein
MLDDLDDETLRLMRAYTGDLGPKQVVVEVASVHADEEWSLSAFGDWVRAAVDATPPEFRDETTVALESSEFYAALKVTYSRPETVEELTARHQEALKYARKRQADDRAEYMRLKAKFEADK